MPEFRWTVIVAACVLSTAPRVGAVVLRLESVSVPATGDTAELCVDLKAQGELVAGTQNDLVWDGSCATLQRSSDCRIDEGTGKSLYGTVAGDFTYRALVLSLTDVQPIPDGRLYCCAFVVDAPAGSCCRVQLENLGASDQYGRAVAVAGESAALCVTGGGPTPTPTPTPITSFRDASAAADSSGCQIAGPPRAGLGAGTLIAAFVVLGGRRSIRRRGRGGRREN